MHKSLRTDLALNEGADTTFGVAHDFNVLDLGMSAEMVRKHSGELLLVDIGQAENASIYNERGHLGARSPADKDARVLRHFLVFWVAWHF